MYLKILVDKDIERGRKLVEDLERKFPITAAFWLNVQDSQEWRLVLVSPLVSTKGPHVVYDFIRGVLDQTQIPISLTSISVFSPTNLRYKQVRLAYRGIPSGLTVARDSDEARNFAGLGFAGDALVYRMD